MTQLFKLLENKNYWYAKYLNCTAAFRAALEHAPEIAVAELELFHGNRDSLLKILEDLDRKIENMLSGPEWAKGEFSSDQKTKIQYFLREKDSIVTKIVELDKEVIASLDKIRAEGAEKLKALLKGKKALSKYKSSTKHDEKIDKRV